jgi:geranylgeranyl diphosphate synthase type I
MDLYQDAIQLLLIRNECVAWPELQNTLNRAFTHRPVAWHFPVKACEAVGARAEDALSAVAAITCAHMAIMLVDDILDEDPRGAYRQLGVGKASNLAVALNGLGIAVLMDTHYPNSAKALNQMIQRTAHGQDLDAMNLSTPDDYWAVTRLKSSPYFGTALLLGSLFGGAALELAEEFRQLGELYGEIMQIHDDLNDSLAAPANVDWLAGRSPLPLLFAQVVDHPDRQRFIELRNEVNDLAALEEAQTILVRCGAISYSVNELMLRHAQAQELLNKMNLSKPESITGLLDEALAPVKHLFAKVGADFDPTI